MSKRLVDLLSDPRLTERVSKLIGDHNEVLVAHDRLRERYAVQMAIEREQIERRAVRQILAELELVAKAPIQQTIISFAEYEADKQAAFDLATDGEVVVLAPDGSAVLVMAGKVEPLGE